MSAVGGLSTALSAKAGNSDVALLSRSTAYAVGDRVIYPEKTGYIMVCTTAGTSNSSAPAFPASVTSGTTTLTDGTVTWTIYDVIAPEIATVNGLSGALAGKASKSDIALRQPNTLYSQHTRAVVSGKSGYVLICSSAGLTASSGISFPSSIDPGVTTITDGSVTWTIYDMADLTAHKSVQSAVVNDRVIKHWNGTSSWYRIWLSGWVEQGGQCKGTNASGNTTTTVAFPVAFADTKYCILKNYNSNGTSSSPVAAHVSFYDKTETSAKTYNWGTVEKDWYACGIGDATEIAALLA